MNPNDVENAAWHFLCVARAESPEQARAALLPVGSDRRVPMRQIYEMFRGTLSPYMERGSRSVQLTSVRTVRGRSTASDIPMQGQPPCA